MLAQVMEADNTSQLIEGQNVSWQLAEVSTPNTAVDYF